jgi:hypothetical protein
MILDGFELSIEVDFPVVTASRGFFQERTLLKATWA